MKKTIRQPSTVVGPVEPGAMPAEHNFAVDRDSWEMAVFKNARHFTVFKYEGNKTLLELNATLRTFPQALMAAKANERTTIYAVTDSGRSVCLDRKDWGTLLVRWTIQKRELARAAIDQMGSYRGNFRKAAYSEACGALLRDGMSYDEAKTIATDVAKEAAAERSAPPA